MEPRNLYSIVLALAGIFHFSAPTFFFPELPPGGIVASRLVGVLLLVAAFLPLFRISGRWMLIIPAIAFSQYLIILYCPQVWLATLVTGFLLVPSVIDLAEWKFERDYQRSVKEIIRQSKQPVDDAVNEQTINKLPGAVQNWLRASGVFGRKILPVVHIVQSGMMMTKPGGKWMPFIAKQYSTITSPAFAWKVKMGTPVMFLGGRDIYENGKGRMLIKLYSLVTVVNSRGPEVDQGSLLRYLAEMCWYPYAAICPYIKWEELDQHAAKATMSYGGVTASGKFFFDNSGQYIRFEAERYFARANKKPTLETWVVSNDPLSIKEVGGIKLPTESTLTWKLKEGDFCWLKLKIESVG